MYNSKSRQSPSLHLGLLAPNFLFLLGNRQRFSPSLSIIFDQSEAATIFFIILDLDSTVTRLLQRWRVDDMF